MELKKAVGPGSNGNSQNSEQVKSNSKQEDLRSASDPLKVAQAKLTEALQALQQVTKDTTSKGQAKREIQYIKLSTALVEQAANNVLEDLGVSNPSLKERTVKEMDSELHDYEKVQKVIQTALKNPYVKWCLGSITFFTTTYTFYEYFYTGLFLSTLGAGVAVAYKKYQAVKAEEAKKQQPLLQPVK